MALAAWMKRLADGSTLSGSGGKSEAAGGDDYGGGSVRARQLYEQRWPGHGLHGQHGADAIMWGQGARETSYGPYGPEPDAS